MRDDLAKRLEKLDCCAVSDALDQAKSAGVVLGLLGLTVRKRITGRILTVQLGPHDGRPPSRHLCTAAVEAAAPGDIIVVANNGRTDVSAWGGMLSLAASLRGVKGVIVDGACRDLDESTDLDFPIYARCAVPVTARSRIVETAWNVPIQIAGVTVTPGDWVVADASGVAFVAQAMTERIVGAAESIMARERAMATDITRGEPISQVMGKSYEESINRIASGEKT